MALKFVKLTNGEEFVADVEDGSKKGMIKIGNPIRFLIAPDGVGAIPYLPFCKNKDHEIDSKLVMLMDEVESEIYNAYQERFGTGIVLSTNSLKISD